MKIEYYSFGKITVDGETYKHDIIITNSVKEWATSDHHHVTIKDIFEIVNNKPEIFIIGKGAYGAVSVDKEVVDYLKNKKIDVIIYKTADACKKFNELKEKGKKVFGLFHLTC